MEPSENKQRIHVIDMIRGFALLGLPFVNVLGLWILNLNLSGEVSDIYIQRILYIFVEGRFFAIFSFLFGVGIYIFLSRIKQREASYIGIYLRRMAILFFIGLIHQFLQPGEALLIYAVMGIILFPFFHLPKQWNAIIGVIGIIVGSVLGAKILLPFPFMLLGIAFGQYKVFETVRTYRKVWIAVACLSFFATTAMAFYLWMQAPSLGMVSYIAGQDIPEFQAHANEEFYNFIKKALMFGPVFTTFYVSFLVVISTFAQKILLPLTAFGRMAFTNYLGQTVLLLAVFHLFVKETIVSYTFATIICAIIVMIQIIISVIWMHFFKYGPLEWLWRCGTYGKMLPIKKEFT